MRAALYARVSSEEQVEGYSIDAQLRACRDFAQEKGWTVAAEYVDEGKSARAEDIGKRPRFKEMLEAAKAKAFDNPGCSQAGQIQQEPLAHSQMLR